MRAKSAAATKGVGAEFMQLIEQMSREKGIDVEILASAVEDAITTASRRQQERTARPAPGGDNATQEVLVSRLNRQTGELQLYARKMVMATVSDGNLEIAVDEARKTHPTAEPGTYVELPRSTKGLGRIEAQAAKQVLFQKVREAEREIVYREYAPRVGQLINGTVKRFERGDLVIDLGRAEALLPRRFQSRIEMYSQGDRVRAIIVEVSMLSKGPQVVLSRTDASLLVKLFEMEVPEIYDGTVLLRQAVREPGERAKIAVSSKEKDVDPVGACVGMKGSRVQAIIRELRGEKIDVVPWAEDINAFAASALNPARVSRVSTVSADDPILEVTVDDQQLSLAIGKRGQNVRLASKLVGRRIDIRSEEEKRRHVEHQLNQMARRSAPVAELPGIAAGMVAGLAGANIETIGAILSAAPDVLTRACDGPEGAASLRDSATAFIEAPAEPDESTGAATTDDSSSPPATEPPQSAVNEGDAT